MIAHFNGKYTNSESAFEQKSLTVFFLFYRNWANLIIDFVGNLGRQWTERARSPCVNGFICLQ